MSIVDEDSFRITVRGSKMFGIATVMSIEPMITRVATLRLP